MNIAKLRDLIVTVADMVLDVFIELFALPEDKWTKESVSEVLYAQLEYGKCDTCPHTASGMPHGPVFSLCASQVMEIAPCYSLMLSRTTS